jgi:hypothetical protein
MGRLFLFRGLFRFEFQGHERLGCWFCQLHYLHTGWVLLLLLSTQPATAGAVSSGSGVLVLIFGIAMTAVAYLWMAKLSQLPELPRVFGEL